MFIARRKAESSKRRRGALVVGGLDVVVAYQEKGKLEKARELRRMARRWGTRTADAEVHPLLQADLVAAKLDGRRGAGESASGCRRRSRSC